jgi:hypothetical protein
MAVPGQQGPDNITSLDTRHEYLDIEELTELVPEPFGGFRGDHGNILEYAGEDADIWVSSE